MSHESYYQAKIPSSILKNPDGSEMAELTEEQKQWDNVMYGDYMIEKVIGYCLSY